MQLGYLEFAHIYSSHSKSSVHRRSARAEMANARWTNNISRVREHRKYSAINAEPFHRFAEYQDGKLKLPIECIVIIEMPNEQCTDSVSLNLIVQNSMGQDIYQLQCKLKNSHASQSAAYIFLIATSGEFIDKIRGKDFQVTFLEKQG